MSDAEKPIRILIVDPSSKFAKEVKSEAASLKDTLGEDSAKAPRPVFVETVRESQSYLSNRDYNYVAVFVNPVVGSPAWLAIIRTSHQFRPNTPVFVVYDEFPAIKKEELLKLGLRGLFKKPIGYQKMLEAIAKANPEFELPGETITAEETSVPTPEAAQPAQDGDFVPVELANMMGSTQSKFDLYVKVGEKYVKLLLAGDTLSAERLDTYKKKGATQLYIPKAAQDQFLSFYDTMVSDILKDSNVSIEVKTDTVLNQGDATLQFLKDSGFSEESLKSAQKYVENSTELVQQISQKSDAVKNLMSDIASFEHGVACATVAGLLIKYLGSQTPMVFNSIGIACFLHDISLVGQPQVIKDEDESKMTPEQKELYYAHPEESAKIIKKMKSVPPMVAVAVAQHHLRIHKRGFPKNKVVEEVNLLAELIGLCEDFVKLVKQKDADPSIDPPEVLKLKGASDYSPAILDAFIRAFSAK